MSLSGLEGCPEVTLLDLWEVNPESLSPIQPIRNLVKLQVKGEKAASSWPAVDIDAVRGMNRLEWLFLLDLGSQRSLIPIRSVPHLKGVKLAGCVIEDGHLSPLVDLPADVHITPPDDRPHYRPSVQQLMAMRSRLTGRG